MAQLSPDAKAALGRQHLDDGVPLTSLAAAAGLPVRTVRCWAATYRNAPTAAALRRQPRSDLGRRRLPEDLVKAIEALALRRPPPTTAYVHRRVADLARDRGLPVPSYSTVRSVVAAIDPGLRTLAHQGDAAYRDQFELVHRRAAARPNEQWQADLTLLDVQVLDAKRQPAPTCGCASPTPEPRATTARSSRSSACRRIPRAPGRFDSPLESATRRRPRRCQMPSTDGRLLPATSCAEPEAQGSSSKTSHQSQRWRTRAQNASTSRLQRGVVRRQPANRATRSGSSRCSVRPPSGQDRLLVRALIGSILPRAPASGGADAEPDGRTEASSRRSPIPTAG